jgi:predicted RNA-binding protein YlxR (DUF448 family)
LVKTRHIPERSCVACRRKLPKRELVRIVRTPLGAVKVDHNGKEAGRGAYLCRSSECWQRGIAKGALERSLKTSISPEDRSQLTAYSSQGVDGPLIGER